MMQSTILLASGKLPGHQLIRDHLTLQGYRLHCPENLAELNAILAFHPVVDFIIFSCDLPGLEDMRPVQQIRELYPGTPILLLMQSRNLETLRVAKILRCNEIIMEPIDPLELDILLKNHIEYHIPTSR